MNTIKTIENTKGQDQPANAATTARRNRGGGGEICVHAQERRTRTVGRPRESTDAQRTARPEPFRAPRHDTQRHTIDPSNRRKSTRLIEPPAAHTDGGRARKVRRMRGRGRARPEEPCRGGSPEREEGRAPAPVFLAPSLSPLSPLSPLPPPPSPPSPLPLRPSPPLRRFPPPREAPAISRGRLAGGPGPPRRPSPGHSARGATHRSSPPHALPARLQTHLAIMRNDAGNVVDLYIPRKWYVRRLAREMPAAQAGARRGSTGRPRGGTRLPRRDWTLESKCW